MTHYEQVLDSLDNGITSGSTNGDLMPVDTLEETFRGFVRALRKSESLTSDGTDFDEGFVAGYKMCIEDIEYMISKRNDHLYEERGVSL